jgi:putative transposase
MKAAVAAIPVLSMEIVRRSDNTKGFVVQPRRWVVERTISRFGRADTLAAFVAIASIRLALKRLARSAWPFDTGRSKS